VSILPSQDMALEEKYYYYRKNTVSTFTQNLRVRFVEETFQRPSMGATLASAPVELKLAKVLAVSLGYTSTRR